MRLQVRDVLEKANLCRRRGDRRLRALAGREGQAERRAFGAVQAPCLERPQWAQVTVHLSTPRTNCSVDCGLWVIIVSHCKLAHCDKWPSLVGMSATGEAARVGGWGRGVCEISVPLSCAVNLKLLEKQSMEINNSIAFVINLRSIPGALRTVFFFLPQSEFGGGGQCPAQSALGPAAAHLLPQAWEVLR